MAATHTELTNEIAEVLWGATSALRTEAVCDRIGMPKADEGAGPMASKRVYVSNRLGRVPLPELREIAQRVVDEFPADAVSLEQLLGGGGFGGVEGELKNIIFAANGPKPKIVLTDALNNVVEIVQNAEYCLVYDRPIPPDGLTWAELVDWWMSHTGEADERGAGRALWGRLVESLASEPERLLFRAYGARLANGPWDVPALIPQVYLHYSPYVRGKLSAGAELPRQRMDFLMLPSERARIVIEVDGQQHYADDSGAASPRRYGEMVREDRAIRLAGYEVFRFGGAELQGEQGLAVATEFFNRLFAVYAAG
jgi:hypothetical protein